MTTQQQGLARKIKHILPRSVFEITRRILNWCAIKVPHGFKYSIGPFFKRRKYPYSLIESGSLVIQVGAPADLIYTGRSRAITFARLATEGLVLVLEPDPYNCDVIRNYCREHGLSKNIRLIEQGAWSTDDTLEFYSSEAHPSSNFLIGANEADERAINERQYRIIKIPVTSLDSIVQSQNLNISDIRLISITTNGAELEILKGMRQILARESPYICLAETGDEYVEALKQLGYSLIAFDDRGFTFARAKVAD